jgi:hypothetical protein
MNPKNIVRPLVVEQLFVEIFKMPEERGTSWCWFGVCPCMLLSGSTSCHLALSQGNQLQQPSFYGIYIWGKTNMRNSDPSPYSGPICNNACWFLKTMTNGIDERLNKIDLKFICKVGG